LWLDNRYYWTEDCIYDVHALNCTTHFQVDCTGALGVGTATFAHDNCWYQLSMAGKAGQNGMYVTNGANLYHSRIWYHGGIDSSSSVTTNYYLKLDSGTSGSGSQMNRCEIVMEMESDGGLANNPITIITAASNTVQDGWGRIAFLNTPQTAQLTGGFSFSGPISGDSVLAGNIPSLVPANGTPTTNAKNPAFMCVSGGTVSAIKINGVTTGLTSGVFLIPVNNTYEIDYTVAPTVNWIPAVPA
ncbi:MAG TPA: hypothetical protein VM782_20345, partial [Stellaceae bacterium]|nr:hypothetical protein [Stellaceae bacterium]